MKSLARFTGICVIAAKSKLSDPLYKNSILLIMSSVISAPLGFVFWVAVARLYSSADVGIASAVISAVGILAAVAGLGMEMGLIRFLGQADNKREMLNTSFTIVSILSVMLTLVFIAGIRLWSPALVLLQTNLLIGFGIILCTATTSLKTVQRSAFIALRSARFALFQDLVWFVSKILLVLALAFLGVSGIIISWGSAMALTLIVSNIYHTGIEPGYFCLPIIKRSVVKKMFRFSLDNYVSNILGGIPANILPLIVLNVLGAKSNAYFYIAFWTANLLFSIPLAVGQSLFAEGSHRPETLRQDTIRAAKFIAVLLLPALVILVVVANKILLLFGQEYAENATGLLILLSLSSLPLSFLALYASTRRVQFQMRSIIVVFLALAILILGLSWLLMRHFGLYGVGLGYTLGECVIAAGVLVTLRIRRKGQKRQGLGPDIDLGKDA